MVSGSFGEADEPDAAQLPFTMMQSRSSEPWFEESWNALLRLGDVPKLDAAEGGRIRSLAFQLFIANPTAKASQEFLRRLTSEKPNPEIVSARQSDAEVEQLKARLAGIEVPVLVITGELDPATAGAVFARATVRAIPGAELCVVPGVGHGLWFEAPDVLRDELRARLSE